MLSWLYRYIGILPSSDVSYALDLSSDIRMVLLRVYQKFASSYERSELTDSFSSAIV
jgi:hypothetical protein